LNHRIIADGIPYLQSFNPSMIQGSCLVASLRDSGILLKASQDLRLGLFSFRLPAARMHRSQPKSKCSLKL